MTTDERIAEYEADAERDRRHGFEYDATKTEWLISELRRAREALKEIRYEFSDGNLDKASSALPVFINRVTSKGLGEL